MRGSGSVSLACVLMSCGFVTEPLIAQIRVTRVTVNVRQVSEGISKAHVILSNGYRWSFRFFCIFFWPLRMYEARSAEYIQIYESIVIQFFLRFKIHKIGTCVPIIDR